ncbi:hypothetical protein PLESTF_001658100 [Pleodorina starrii]|nr:hypothetical protein PLESTM_001621500 [Pleodorina starrii]GLC75568.1 hypothetical protein PLESTF_001658100 [Pleodorina starrii]
MTPFGSGVGVNHQQVALDDSDAPQKGLTCSIARYAFEAKQMPTPPYVRGTAGPANVIFLDEAFVQQNLNCPGGGLLEVTFTDASSLQQSFAAVELSVELCSLNSSSSSSSSSSNRISAAVRRSASQTTTTTGGGGGGVWGGAVKVSPPASKEPILLGVRDKTQDVLHLTLYGSDGSSATAGASAAPVWRYVATIQLSDVPEGANVPPAVKEVTLQQQQQQQGSNTEGASHPRTTAAGGGGTAPPDTHDESVASGWSACFLACCCPPPSRRSTPPLPAARAEITTTGNDSIRSWRLIPFSACKQLPQPPRQQQHLLQAGRLPSKEQQQQQQQQPDTRPMAELQFDETQLAEMRGVTALVKGLCDLDSLNAADRDALARFDEDLARRQQQQRLQPQLQAAPPPPNWDALNQAAGGPNLKPLAVAGAVRRQVYTAVDFPRFDGWAGGGVLPRNGGDLAELEKRARGPGRVVHANSRPGPR